MITRVLKVSDQDPFSEEDLRSIRAGAEIIRRGGLVAFRTETVYGLGGNALDKEASGKIYAAKGRPSDNPLIAHVCDMDMTEEITEEIPETGRRLAEAFWPGPMTLIFRKNDRVPLETTGGLDTVAVRMPSDRQALMLIREAGVPIAAPSANTSGRPSPTKAEHVYQDLSGKIDMILDGGQTGIGLESTIVDVTGEVPMLLRPGAVTMEMLREAVGTVETDPAITGPVSPDVHPRAPGMKYRHYAPKAELTLVEGETEKVVSRICALAAGKIAEGKKVGIICTDETRNRYPLGSVLSIGKRGSEASVAHNLYAVLREFDDRGMEFIYSEGFPEDHLGQAIMNRLNKAAGYHIEKV
ncbi:MAG: threonylcarbamoyl-AMP synthase [Clostridium sp.]|nr:threonylcarbamoyl-AMP synthase [Clostridium sp.]MBO6150770.1 threonylcarbamoyl-AMP synthase [Clostridium sp.]